MDRGTGGRRAGCRCSALQPGSTLPLQVTASQLTVPPATCTVLLLAESEGERKRWLQVLGELQRLLLDAQPRPRPVYTLKEAYDNGLPLLSHALCAAIVGEPHAEGVPACRGHSGCCHCRVPAAQGCGPSCTRVLLATPLGMAVRNLGWGGVPSFCHSISLHLLFCLRIASERKEPRLLQ